MDDKRTQYLTDRCLLDSEKYGIKFSIILPAFNREKVVPFAINSVLKQDYPNWECIIVDDASTDGTYSVCDSFAKKDSRIRVYSQTENKGVSAARNKGMQYATGDYILFLDSDDSYKEDALLRLSAICSSGDYDMVVFAIKGWWVPSELISNRVLDKEFIHEKILPEHINICEHTYYFLQAYIWHKCYKRNWLSEHGIEFEEQRKVWEDNTFLVKCFDKCRSMYIIQDQLHIPGTFPDIDHLSFHVDETVILQYIDGYKNNLRQFGNEYDFDNSYTPRRYFDVINQLLNKLFPTVQQKDFKNVLGKLVNEQVMQEWIGKILPKDITEKLLSEAYASKDVDGLYYIYRDLSEKEQEPSSAQISEQQNGFKKSLRRIINKIKNR